VFVEDYAKKSMEEPLKHVFERSKRRKKIRSGDAQIYVKIFTGK